MSVVLKNLSEFDAKVKAWFGAVEKLAETAAKGVALHVLGVAATITPQYSGTTAANWKINDSSWERDPLGTKDQDEPAASVGDRRAVGYALMQAKGRLAGFKLGKTIYINNSTMGEAELDSLAVRLDEGKIKLRPVNEGYYDMRNRSVRIVGNKYRLIGKVELAALGGLVV